MQDHYKLSFYIGIKNKSIKNKIKAHAHHPHAKQHSQAKFHFVDSEQITWRKLALSVTHWDTQLAHLYALRPASSKEQQQANNCAIQI